LLHDLSKIHARFDDPNLVSRAGLVPVMALAQRAGLGGLAGEHVRIARPCGVNPQVKVPGIVAGMIGGADSIDDLGLLRHGAMGALFGGVRAPSTLGSFLRSFTWGNVLQLGKVNRLLLAELASRAPLLPGKDVLAFVDIDAQQKRVYGHRKQGAGFGHTKIQSKSLLVRGLNALVATVSTPLGAPVIAGARLRGGTANSARGAAPFVTQAVHTARAAGVHRHARGADGLGLLQRRGVRRGPGGRGVLLGHGGDEPARAGRDRGHRRGRLDPHPVPPGPVG
jgi:hypothetical protein